MDLQLNGRKALVVGASRGLGRVVARLLAAEGCAVGVVARSASELDRVVAELPGSGHRAFSCDCLLDGSTTRLAAECMATHQPDIVVHNLGGSLGVTDSLASAADYARVWRLNVGVPVEFNQVFVPAMANRGWGRVVHVSSVSAENFSGYSAYVAAKGGLNAYVKTLGRAVAAKGVVVSAVCPGPLFAEGRHLSQLQTAGGAPWRAFCDHHLAIGRLADPGEVAPFIALLCSPLASYAAGTIVNVDGGSR